MSDSLNLCGAASPSKDVPVMVGIYEKFGVRVPYPENWEVEEGPPEQWPQSVALHSPGTGFWTLSIHAAGQDPAELLARALNAIRGEYEDVDAEAVSEQIAGVPARGFDVNFFCQHFVVSAELRAFSVAGRTLLALYQAEDREFQELLPVFRAMITGVIDPDFADHHSDI